MHREFNALSILFTTVARMIGMKRSTELLDECKKKDPVEPDADVDLYTVCIAMLLSAARARGIQVYRMLITRIREE